MTPDPIFDDPRLAAVYDLFEGERTDLALYETIVDEFAVQSVLDVGCGTGSLCLRLVGHVADVTGLDPAAASLAVARAKPGADRVRWILGDASAAPPLAVDMATMTGNVAQVFTTDESWDAALRSVRRALTVDGLLVFETRDPTQRAWERWTPDATRAEVVLDDGRRVVSETAVAKVHTPFVTFVTTFSFRDSTGVEEIRSESTLRFRSRSEVEASLDDAGFDVIDVRDAPDRPGREFVFIARRRD